MFKFLVFARAKALQVRADKLASDMAKLKEDVGSLVIKQDETMATITADYNKAMAKAEQDKKDMIELEASL